MDEDIILILVMGLILLIPVTGITLRFALKPIVDSLARLMEVRAGGEERELFERRIALLEQELNSMRLELRQVSETREFYDRLTPGR
jgi:hypothetical protein